MADTPKTPAPPRRKAATGTRKTTRSTPPKAKVPAEASGTAGAVKAAAPRKAPAKRTATPRKPAADPSVATRATSTAKSAATKARRTAGDAAGKVADGASTARRSVAQSAPVQLVSDTRERMGNRNFFAALVGGVAAIGAAVGGILYAVRDGTQVGKTPRDTSSGEDKADVEG